MLLKDPVKAQRWPKANISLSISFAQCYAFIYVINKPIIDKNLLQQLTDKDKEISQSASFLYSATPTCLLFDSAVRRKMAVDIVVPLTSSATQELRENFSSS